MTTMHLEVQYKIGQCVWLKSDPESLQRTVVGYRVNPGGSVMYLLCSGPFESGHYACEISPIKVIAL